MISPCVSAITRATVTCAQALRLDPTSDRGGAVEVGQHGGIQRLVQKVEGVGRLGDHRCGDRSIAMECLMQVSRHLLTGLLDKFLHGLLGMNRAQLRIRFKHRVRSGLHLPVLFSLLTAGGGAVPLRSAIGVVSLFTHGPPAGAHAVFAPQVAENALTLDAIAPRGADRGAAPLLIIIRIELRDEGVLEGILLLLDLSCPVPERLHARLELEVAHELLVVELLSKVDEAVGIALLVSFLLLLCHGPERLASDRLCSLALFLRRRGRRCLKVPGGSILFAKGTLRIALGHHLPDALALLFEEGLHALATFLALTLLLLVLRPFPTHLILQLLEPLDMAPQGSTGTAFLHGWLKVLARRQARLVGV
mmetsp:Transcript_46811/g.100090  ORF Transcript_46811/g.100090 Transcript_46811/m.100090 type:complete len:364 (+) Transcript_46811:30-1121(+)